MSFVVHRRVLLRAGLAAAVGTALAGCGTAAPPTALAPASSRLRLLGETRLPSKMVFKGTTVGGLSALDFDPARNAWVALSDDRSELQPARFYTLAVDVRPQALSVAVTDVITLRQANGQPYPPRRNGGEVVDPEGMRLLPGGGGVLWCSEGESRVNQHPAVHASRLDGTHVRSFEVPTMLQFPQRPGTGPRDNQCFEGLALTPDARTAWVAMEGALLQDGPLPKVGAPGGPCRFTAFDVTTGLPTRQIAYIPEAIPVKPRIPGTYADNGVSEILMLDAHRMLVLERAYALGTGNALRLFEIDTREAGDTLQQAKLEPGQFRPAAKELVADFAQLGLSLLDNTEGMCWGPPLPSGARTLVVVSDDNFNASQVTQFAAFEYLE